MTGAYVPPRKRWRITALQTSTIYNAGHFPCNCYTHYMTSSTSIDINLAGKEMVILCTKYVGEMKKGLFSLVHYLMPKREILSSHSGCIMGKDDNVALFFGLSGNAAFKGQFGFFFWSCFSVFLEMKQSKHAWSSCFKKHDSKNPFFERKKNVFLLFLIQKNKFLKQKQYLGP